MIRKMVAMSVLAGFGLLSVACGAESTARRPTSSVYTTAQAASNETGACYCEHSTKYCATAEGLVATDVCW